VLTAELDGVATLSDQSEVMSAFTARSHVIVTDVGHEDLLRAPVVSRVAADFLQGKPIPSSVVSSDGWPTWPSPTD
jgi:hypothetical protein